MNSIGSIQALASVVTRALGEKAAEKEVVEAKKGKSVASPSEFFKLSFFDIIGERGLVSNFMPKPKPQTELFKLSFGISLTLKIFQDRNAAKEKGKLDLAGAFRGVDTGKATQVDKMMALGVVQEEPIFDIAEEKGWISNAMPKVKIPKYPNCVELARGAYHCVNVTWVDEGGKDVRSWGESLMIVFASMPHSKD